MQVRLSHQEISAIKECINDFDKNAKIYLFGSRVDLDKKGGDIDLLVMSDVLSDNYVLKIKRCLFEKIEEQKVDILIARNDSDPFVKIALRTGKLL